MKVPPCSYSSLPSWTHCKNALIGFIAVVAVFIVVFIAYHGASSARLARFYKSKRYDPSKTNKLCKQSPRQEAINWNYFYYYEDVKTKKSLVWCKVPKAGSTTLTKMFLRLAGAKDISNTTRIHKLLRNYYPRLSSKVMTHRIRDSKTFVVVRDPFERILSAYRDKLESYERDLEYRDGYYYDHYGRFMVKDEKTGMTGNFTTTRKEPTWPEFVQYLLKTSVARYDEHWMPITRLCSPCKVDYNIVIKMENFAREIRQPLNYAKIDVASLGWAHKTGTSTNRKIINGYFKNLTLTDVKKLYAKYKKDFQLFGYTPFKYFKLFNNNNEQNKTVTE